MTIEPMAVAVHALRVSGAHPGDTIAVIGLGAIGLLLTHLALALGYRVIITELNPAKVQMAVALGAVALCPPAPQADLLAQEWLDKEVCAVFERPTHWI